MKSFLRAIFLLLTCTSLGCSWATGPYFESAVIGGATGTAVGAGTGAIVGAAIANGDIAASAILGGAIGLPAGILLGLAYQYYAHETELEENNTQIVQNYNYIVSRQNQLNKMREDVASDYQAIEVDRSERANIFTGATIGTYNR